MALLIVGLVVFLGIHSSRIFASDLRGSLIARFGENGWKGIYSVLSIVSFIVLIVGYGMARQDAGQIYTPPNWGRALALLFMPIAFILLVASQIPGGYIKRVVGHPMLWGVILWSTAHLTANGDTASVTLFGAFMIWSVLDLISCYRRPGGEVSAPKIWADGVAIAVGLIATYVFIAFAHEWLIGVSVV